MNKKRLATILTRLYFCNDSKLETTEEYINMRNYLLRLDDSQFYERLKNIGLHDKEAS